MPMSSFLYSFPKFSCRHPLNHCPRFGPYKGIQSCSYTKSSRQSGGKANRGGDCVMPIEKKAPYSWTVYAIPAALLGFAGLATFVHYNDERRAIPRGQGKNHGYATVKGPIIGGPFTLINTEKQIVTEKNFLGNWVLLYFGYTSSPDVGPEQVQMMAKAVDMLESKRNMKVLPVFVTIDPQRDTPAQLRAYLKEFDSRIMGLTGQVNAVRQMVQEYRVYFKKIEEEGDDYLVESSHNMYLMNPSMEVMRCFGVEYTAEELAAEILKELQRTAT